VTPFLLSTLIAYYQVMLKFLRYWLWDIDKPPDRMGFFGYLIIAVFVLFAVWMWFHHSAPGG
jgi:hypothetical protein